MTKRRLIWLVTAALGLFIGSVAVYREWTHAENFAVLSCASSIAAALERLDAAEPGAVNASGGEWQLLSQSTVDALASRIRPGDCASRESLRDRWGTAFRIGVRQTSEGKPQFLVWSYGRDRRSHTADDLVEPYGEKPPQSEASR